MAGTWDPPGKLFLGDALPPCSGDRSRLKFPEVSDRGTATVTSNANAGPVGVPSGSRGIGLVFRE